MATDKDERFCLVALQFANLMKERGCTSVDPIIRKSKNEMNEFRKRWYEETSNFRAQIKDYDMSFVNDERCPACMREIGIHDALGLSERLDVRKSIWLFIITLTSHSNGLKEIELGQVKEEEDLSFPLPSSRHVDDDEDTNNSSSAKDDEDSTSSVKGLSDLVASMSKLFPKDLNEDIHKLASTYEGQRPPMDKLVNDVISMLKPDYLEKIMQAHPFEKHFKK